MKKVCNFFDHDGKRELEVRLFLVSFGLRNCDHVCDDLDFAVQCNRLSNYNHVI